MGVYELMERLRGMLEEFPHASLKIGLEEALNPDDYPLLRVVPDRNELDGSDAWAQDIYFSVYVGDRLDPLSLEAGYKRVYDVQNAIFTKLHNYQFGDGGLIRFISSERSEKYPHFLVLKNEFKIESFRL